MVEKEQAESRVDAEYFGRSETGLANRGAGNSRDEPRPKGPPSWR
jgi:hypothetical protein